MGQLDIRLNVMLVIATGEHQLLLSDLQPSVADPVPCSGLYFVVSCFMSVTELSVSVCPSVCFCLPLCWSNFLLAYLPACLPVCQSE